MNFIISSAISQIGFFFLSEKTLLRADMSALNFVFVNLKEKNLCQMQTYVLFACLPVIMFKYVMPYFQIFFSLPIPMDLHGG